MPLSVGVTGVLRSRVYGLWGRVMLGEWTREGGGGAWVAGTPQGNFKSSAESSILKIMDHKIL